MDEPNINPQLMMASSDATIRHLYARTATFIDTQDRPLTSRDKWEIFSGTFVKIEDRLFVVTVSHSLNNFDNPSRYVLTTKDGNPHPNSTNIVRRTIATDYDRPDVGRIELDLERFRAFDGFETIDISKISVVPPERQLASLMGTTAETIRIHPTENNKWGISGTLSGFTTAAININEWPELNLPKNPLDPQIDLLVKYPEDSPDIRDCDGRQSDLPKPNGTSGGGLWIHDGCQSDIWSPYNCQLVGIQSSWLRDAKYIRLTRICHWLDLVHLNYPDMRDALGKIDGYAFNRLRMVK